jgi:SAM-dependent methyltransferase
MSLKISASEQTELTRLWMAWDGSENLELESTFPVKTYVDYMHIMEFLQSLGLRAEDAPAKLNIILPGGLRISIVGDDKIQEYYDTGKLTEYHILLKQRYGPKETPDEVILSEYDVKVKVRRELALNKYDSRVKAALSEWPTSLKTFRYMKRSSFTSTKNPGIQFDSTIVRQSRRPSRTLQESGTMTRPDHYEVEVEAKQNIAGSLGMKGFLTGIARVLQGLQQSYVILTKTVTEAVLRAIGDFPGSQPATLMMENIAMEKTVGTPNIRFDDYNVTDKADGDRCLLYIAEDGRVYLMDKDQHVYGTDRQIADPSTFGGVLLDGEWIHRNAKGEAVNYYYAFDIYNGRNGLDVTKRPFYVRVKDADTRLQEMQEVVAVLRDAAFVVKGIPAAMSLQITMKTFQPVLDPSVPGGIFAEAKSVLDRVNPPYHTDGLIFTPNATPLPRGKGSWAAQLKWKPAEENTIDFLVHMEPASVMKTNNESLQLCKILHLYVGSSEDVIRDPRKILLLEEPLPLPTDANTYRPIEFISDPFDPYASVCYVPIKDGNIYTSRINHIIRDNSIVEMAYHPDRSIGFRWEPTRVRWDKTSRYLTGTYGRTFNNDKTAASVWTSIHEPITKDIITTGLLFSKKEMMDMTKLYYKVGISASDKLLTKGLQKFHNQIKERLLLKSTLRSFKDPLLLDMSCGKGGDLDKWIKHGAHFVLGCDIAESGLNDPRDSIYKRYIEKIQERGGRDRIPPMLFLQADASKLYADGTAGMTPEDRAMLRCVWGLEESTVPPLVQKYKGIASSGFDVIAMMFTLHYMFQDRATLDGWILNLAASLKVDGYFVGCCFDGDAVAKALQAVPEGKLLSGVQKDTTLWSIRKRYDDSYSGYLPPTDESIGRAIDVYFASIGEEFTEYLVSFPYLEKRLREIGCELLTEEEYRAIGLHNSTAMFETSHKMMSDSGEVYPMLPVVQEYSNFHRWFIFKRRTGAISAPVTTGTPPSLIIRPAEEDLPAEIITHAPPMLEEELIMLDDIDAPIEEAAVDESPPVEESHPESAEDLIAIEPSLRPVSGPILKFYEKSAERDDLKIKRPDWGKYLSTATPFPFHDREDPSIVYPNLEAALASEKYKVATKKPEIGPAIFTSLSNISEIRTKSKDLKKHGFDPVMWDAQKEDILHEYLSQRFELDEVFQQIMTAVGQKEIRLVFYTGPTTSNELGGLVKGDSIEGENLYGKALMALVGTTY